MKGSTIWTIIILMSVALVGLTSFQVYWINKSVQLNRKTFKENVISSLHQVASNLERYEVAKMASANVMTFYSKEEKNYKFIYKEEGISVSGQKFVIYDHDSVPVSEMHRGPRLVRPPKPVKDIEKWELKNVPFNIEVVTDSVANVWTDSSKRVLSKVQMVNVVLDRLTSRETELHRKIDIDLIDSMLNKSLVGKGIGIDYEFAVWNATKDSVIDANTSNLGSLRKSELKAALFPNDLFNNANYLLLNFPSQSSFLYKQIWTTLAASILFILIIVTCFSYAIYIIFRQKKVSEIKNDFINNMTHELKTPIATVSLAVEALNEKEMRSNEATLLRYLGMIKDENTRLFNQVEKVLQSAILEKESFSIKEEKLSMHQLINQATANLMIAVEDKKGKLDLHLNALRDNLLGDEHHLTNVLRNLIDNAIKYSVDQPSIAISTSSTDDSFEINVEDKGIGMSKDTIKRIFDKFYRVPTGNRHDVKGFGLGLSYVKTIVDKHGGEIHVDSALGKGSNFKITLPYDR